MNGESYLFIFGFFSGIIVAYISLQVYKYKIYKQGKENDRKERKKIGNEEIEELIKKEQAKVWKNFTGNTEINIRTLMDESIYLIKQIAGKYYPESTKPELEVTIEELLKMNMEVSKKALEKLETKPFNILKKVKLYHIHYTKNKWQEIQNNVIYKKLKKYKIWEVGKKVWMTFNFLNIAYWLRKIGINFTREFLIRMFRAYLIRLIGEEADKLFGGKKPKLRIEKKD
ncbi:MAG: hypothetical protein B6I28_03165 [Fusobacteriia bacterium 4572_132]|nr:MAG: hypothetical protein B6I28_03165 [Fusobacteriia bacterium 4572_132]